MRRIALATLGCLLILAASAEADCAWVLWYQTESPWTRDWYLLNYWPGPTRGNPQIQKEYASREACGEDQIKYNGMTIQEELPTKRLGVPTVFRFACIPLPLKPVHIGDNGWR
jgi:hypothetical protein